MNVASPEWDADQARPPLDREKVARWLFERLMRERKSSNQWVDIRRFHDEWLAEADALIAECGDE